MGFNCSYNLYLKPAQFLQGLEKLRPYELLIRSDEERALRREKEANFPYTSDPYYELLDTPIDEIVTDFPKLLAQVHQEENLEDILEGNLYPEDSKEDLLKCSLYRENPAEGIITLNFYPRTKYFYYPGIWKHGHILVDVAFSLDKNQSFISYDHPSLSFVREVLLALKPVYGHLEGDWPSWWYRPTDESIPWGGSYGSPVIGPALAERIKPLFDLSDPDSGLINYHNLEGMYWLTSEYSEAEWQKQHSNIYGPPRNDAERRHGEAHVRLIEALRTVPVSFLGEL
jgi:hypothetical protein